MVKYNWSELQKEYLLGNFKSVSEFLRVKGINRSGNVQKAVKGWGEKKVQNEQIKSSRTIEKVIEKESTKEANKLLNIKDTAEALLKKINDSMLELDKYFSRNTTKTKKVKYDYQVGKPIEEKIVEEEKINEFFSIIDRSGLKQLTSALKDINDIINNNNDNKDNLFAEEIENAWRNRK